MEVIKNTNFVNFLPNKGHSNNKFIIRDMTRYLLISMNLGIWNIEYDFI